MNKNSSETGKGVIVGIDPSRDFLQLSILPCSNGNGNLSPLSKKLPLVVRFLAKAVSRLLSRRGIFNLMSINQLEPSIKMLISIIMQVKKDIEELDKQIRASAQEVAEVQVIKKRLGMKESYLIGTIVGNLGDINRFTK